MIIMVPCYNEGDKELRKTIDSVMDTSYPDDNKCLLVIADGNITGKGEKMSTPETLAKLLGYKMNPNEKVYNCKSIGELTENRAKIKYGMNTVIHALGFNYVHTTHIDNFVSAIPRHLQRRREGAQIHCDC